MIEFRRRVAPEVFANFPVNERELSRAKTNVIYPASLYKTGYCGIFLSFSYDSLQFYERWRAHEDKAESHSISEDNCHYVISKSSSIDEFGQRCLKVFFVPDLTDTLTGLNRLRLDKDSRFFFFRSKPGRYINLDPDFISESDYAEGVNPNGIWTDGFSSGAVANPKTREIVYWILVW
ncbi:MAG: hypothetical protein ACK5V5_14950 [Cyclobacteriaceae bacterium]